MSRSRFLVAAVAVAMISVACSGDSAEEATTTPGSDATTAGDSGGSTASIEIADFAFSGPDSVGVGTTVTVSNEDGISHTFTSEDDVFDSDAIGPGETFEFTFEDPGEYTYFCKFHSQMTGTLTVEG